MADRKITDLTALTTPASNDVLPIVDVSEAAAVDKNKKITVEELLRGAPNGTAAAPSFAFESDGGNGLYLAGTDTVGISTNGTGRLFIDSSGRLLAGTSTARANFFNGTTDPYVQLEGTDTPKSTVAAIRCSDNAGSPRFVMGKGRGSSVGLNTIVNVSDTLGEVSFQGNDGTEFVEAATIKAEVDGTPGANDMPGRLVFSTTADGAASPVERLRITSDGKVGVGTSSPGTPLHVLGGSAGNTATFGGINQGTSGCVGGFILGTDTDSASRRLWGIRGEASSAGALGIFCSTNNSTTPFSGDQRVTIDSSGRVGIGTSSPGEKLHIAGNATLGTSSSDAPVISLYGNPGATFGASPRIQFANQNSYGIGFTSEVFSATGIDLRMYDGDNTANRGISVTGSSGTPKFKIGMDGVGYVSSKLGIGVTAPEQLLHIGGNNGIRFGNAGATPKADISYTASGDEFLDIKIQGTTTGYGNIRFSTGPTPSERARIDSSGRLLVGTSSSVQVYQGATTFNSELQVAGSSASLTIARSVGSGNLFLARNQTVIDGSTLGVISFNGGDGTNIRQAAEISAVVDGTPGTGDMPGRIVLATTADGASSPTERMRISNNGVVTIKNGAVAEIGTLTDGATITPNFASNCNFTVTLGGARTIANPTNVTAGQSGSIFIVQDATGGRTASWGSNWDWAGGTAPTLSTGANAVDRVDYICRSATSIHAVYTGNYS